MVFIAKILVLALTAAATPILRRDAITVENDINQKIAPQLDTLYHDVADFPASGLAGKVAIQNDFDNLVVVVDDATKDVQSSGSFSEADGTNILGALQSVIPSLSNTLSSIEEEVSAWAGVPGGQALVLSDLRSLKVSFDAFIDALTAAAPSDLVPALASIKDQIDKHFNSAIATYNYKG